MAEGTAMLHRKHVRRCAHAAQTRHTWRILPAMRRTARTTALLSTIGLLMFGSAIAAPALAQSPDPTCSIRVKPREGGPGTEFQFSGTGYAPTRLVLRREDGTTRNVEIIPEEDSFSIALIAGPKDTGAWRATAVEPAGCRASARFSVGLPPTSTEAVPADGGQDVTLLGLAALGGLFVAASVVAIPRVTRSARTR
jgi:hypothetical protein